MSNRSEPVPARPRPIPMKRILAPWALALSGLLLVACGSAETSSTDGKDRAEAEPVPAKVGRCTSDSPAVVNARTLTAVDLDGDRTGDPVKVTAANADCPDLLFARLGGRYVSAQLPSDQPPALKAFGVQVSGREGALLAVRADHPRGGFQLRLYGAGADDDLVELTADGHALVPFIALDVQEHPLSIDCERGGVVVTEAVSHEPHGVVLAWDVKRTSYAVDGTRVRAGKTREIADNVLPTKLSSKYGALVRHALFDSCRAS